MECGGQTDFSGFLAVDLNGFSARVLCKEQNRPLEHTPLSVAFAAWFAFAPGFVGFGPACYHD
jgi:hypothetical protein